MDTRLAEVRKAIHNTKRSLKRKAKKRGKVWKGFGEQEVKRLMNAFDYNKDFTKEGKQISKELKDFLHWCRSYELEE